MPVNTFFTHMIAAQKPLQQPGGSISVGAARVAEIDAQFDFSGYTAGVGEAFAVVGLGLFVGQFDRGTNSFGTLDPLNGNDMSSERWLVHRQATMLIPTGALLAASTASISTRCPRIGFRYRRPIVVNQGENISIVVSLLAPAGFVSLAGVSWIRWRYSKVW